MGNKFWPDNKREWIELLLLIVIIFLIYYIGLFASLHRSYDLLARYQHAEQKAVSDNLDLKVRMESSFPRYFGDFEASYVDVTITNESEDENGLIEVHTYPITCTDTYYDNDVSFLDEHSLRYGQLDFTLYPKESVSYRLSFYSAADTRERKTITCITRAAVQPGIGVTSSVKLIEVPYGSIRSNRWVVLSLGVFKRLLYPPWSNMWIITSVTLARYLFSTEVGRGENGTSGGIEKDLKAALILKSLLQSLMGAMLMWETALTLIYLPFAWEQVVSVWGINGIIFSIIIIVVVVRFFVIKVIPFVGQRLRSHENFVVVIGVILIFVLLFLSRAGAQKIDDKVLPLFTMTCIFLSVFIGRFIERFIGGKEERLGENKEAGEKGRWEHVQSEELRSSDEEEIELLNEQP